MTLGIPDEIANRIKTQNTNPTITMDELYVVAKALEKAIVKGVFTKDELQIVGKAWNKQLCECENYLRQQRLNAFIATREEPKEEPKDQPKEQHHHHKTEPKTSAK